MSLVQTLKLVEHERRVCLDHVANIFSNYDNALENVINEKWSAEQLKQLTLNQYVILKYFKFQYRQPRQVPRNINELYEAVLQSPNCISGIRTRDFVKNTSLSNEFEARLGAQVYLTLVEKVLSEKQLMLNKLEYARLRKNILKSIKSAKTHTRLMSLVKKLVKQGRV